MGIVCQKCRDTFPDNEEVVCMGCNASLVSDSCFHEGRYEKVSALQATITDLRAKLAEAEGRTREVIVDYEAKRDEWINKLAKLERENAELRRASGLATEGSGHGSS